MIRHDPTNADDLIDSRDIIKRISELEDEREALTDAISEAQERANANPSQGGQDETPTEDALEKTKAALIEWDTEEGAELKTLQDLADQAEGYADNWKHGASLIRDSYFETYAQDLAEDIGAVPRDVAWPCTCIDWKRATDELKQDYTSADFDGVDYWIR